MLARRARPWHVVVTLTVWATVACGDAGTEGSRQAVDPAGVREEFAGVGPDVDTDPGAGQAARPPKGRWERLPDNRLRAALPPQVAETIERLEAIGYASGTQRPDDGYPVGVTRFDEGAAHPGLNLVLSGHAPEAVLLDMRGELRHVWRSSFEAAFPDRVRQANPRTRLWRRVFLAPDGRLLAIYEGKGLVALDRDSNVLWGFPGGAHHDVDVAPDGRIHVLTRVAHIKPSYDPVSPIVEDFVTILDPDGRELRSLSLVDVLLASEHAQLLGTTRGETEDLLHTNTIEWLDGRHAARHPAFARGNVLVSMRSIDLLAVIDLEDGSMPWSMLGSWRRQHQPVLLDSGNLLLFDNGLPEAQRSAVLELDPLSGEELWAYRSAEPGDFFSKTCGSSERLPNGNTLITETDYGRAFEVTRDGEIVWEFHNPHRAGEQGEFIASLFEVIRIEEDSVRDWLD